METNPPGHSDKRPADDFSQPGASQIPASDSMAGRLRLSLKTKILLTFLIAFASALGLLLFMQYTFSSDALLRAVAERLRGTDLHLMVLADTHMNIRSPCWKN